MKKLLDSFVNIYRKKPVEIEAWEFTREALKSNDSWVRLYVNEIHLISQYAGEVLYIEIDTLEGTMRANLGDYIIKGIQGEFYPCKPDIFEQTYEEVRKLKNDLQKKTSRDWSVGIYLVPKFLKTIFLVYKVSKSEYKKFKEYKQSRGL